MSLDDMKRLPISIFVHADAEAAVRTALLRFEVSVGTAGTENPRFVPCLFPEVTNFFAARFCPYRSLFCHIFITDIIIGFP